MMGESEVAGGLVTRGAWVAVIVGCLLAAGAMVTKDEVAKDEKGSSEPAPSPPATAAGQARERLLASDDFSGKALDPRAWSVYDSAGHAGNGRRSPSAVSVRGGVLKITGTADGTTGGVAWLRGARKFGRWEARIRMSRGCACYHPVLLLWPVNGGGGVAPKGGGGEIDYTETADDGSRRQTSFFLHYGPEDQDRQIAAQVSVDLTRWHTFAVDWTPAGIDGYVDGRRWFHTDDAAALPPGPMGQAIQLDWFPADQARTAKGIDPRTPATLEVDWIHMYGM